MKISGTRVKSGDECGGSKDMRSGMNSSGGPVGNPRASKPVKGTVNASTVKVSSAEVATRPVSGGRSK